IKIWKSQSSKSSLKECKARAVLPPFPMPKKTEVRVRCTSRHLTRKIRRGERSGIPRTEKWLSVRMRKPVAGCTHRCILAERVDNQTDNCPAARSLRDPIAVVILWSIEPPVPMLTDVAPTLCVHHDSQNQGRYRRRHHARYAQGRASGARRLRPPRPGR